MRYRALSFGNGFSSVTTFSKRTRISFADSSSSTTAIVFLRRNSSSFKLLCRKRTYEFVEGVKFDGPMICMDDIVNNGDIDLVFENCITRTLSPALTLEEGLERIKEAVQTLRLDPPCCSSGFLRFQVAVPPGPKALSWFCCQPESSGVFPQIYLSKNSDNPTCKSLHVNGRRGVFGIGAAAAFTGYSSLNTGTQSLFKRYISSDSTLIVAYGFMDINFNQDSDSVNHEDGSFFFFVPQIELDEQDVASVLTSTLAWDDSSLSTFKEALHYLEISLNQLSRHICPTTDTWQSDCTTSALRKFSLVENRSIPRSCFKLVGFQIRKGKTSELTQMGGCFAFFSLIIESGHDLDGFFAFKTPVSSLFQILGSDFFPIANCVRDIKGPERSRLAIGWSVVHI
ncbi:protein PHYLLO, chloroplastic-like [Neltuma alba]|uniref:protein PHYLLO, chloroplastic-like n=1 Tax=Neltuma alba TaxID=207710 RepID=UPI0010A2C02A|nr:protein PHYLLO, chloroplastic-like [Prosopis alba]